MADSALKNPSPEEIIGKLSRLLDDERTGKYVYFLPVSEGVRIGMSHPDYIIPTIVSVCRQVLKRFLDGESRESINGYLRQTIRFDKRYANMAIGQTLDCAAISAKIMKGELSHEQAVANLLTAQNADRRAVIAMLQMVDETVKQSDGKYTAEQLSELQDAVSPLAGLYWIVGLLTLVVWVCLMYLGGFRWWTGLLCAVVFYLFGFVFMCYMDVQLEKR